MSRGVNKVILVGNLGADPETRYTKGGAPVTNFQVATSENWRDKESGQVEERTEWHRVTTFGRLAEVAGEYLRKGSKVYIEGSLRTTSYEKEGQKHYSTDIIARELQMLDSRPAGESRPASERPAAGAKNAGSSATQRPRQRPAPSQGGADFDDDIPF